MVGSVDYRLDPTVPYGTVFGYSYYGDVGFNLYNPFTNYTQPPSYEKEVMIYFKKNTRISEVESISQILGQCWTRHN